MAKGIRHPIENSPLPPLCGNPIGSTISAMALNILLISTYEMGRQPFGLASPAAWLREAGFTVRCLDLSVDPLEAGAARAADLIGFYVPMHMGTRSAVPVIAQIR
ncbi:MAG: hypothetical protein U0401_18205 [Anaerolineae bacterium]